MENIHKQITKDTKPSRANFIKVLQNSGLKDIFPDNKIEDPMNTIVGPCMNKKKGKINKILRMKYWEVVDYIAEAKIEFPLQL